VRGDELAGVGGRLGARHDQVDAVGGGEERGGVGEQLLFAGWSGQVEEEAFVDAGFAGAAEGRSAEALAAEVDVDGEEGCCGSARKVVGFVFIVVGGHVLEEGLAVEELHVELAFVRVQSGLV